MPPQPTGRQRWWWLLLGPKWLLIEIPGAIVTLGTLFLWIQISPTVDSPQSSDILLSPPHFLIENESRLFSLEHVTVECVMDEIRFSGETSPNLLIWATEAIDPATGHSIPPGRARTVICLTPAFGGVKQGAPPPGVPPPLWFNSGERFFGTLDHARAKLTVHYRTFGVSRSPVLSQHYCWDRLPSPRWTICDPL